MKIAHRFHDFSRIGPVYLVGGSVRDSVLNRRSSDHDFVVPGNVRTFAEKVAKGLGVRLIELGKDSEAICRVVSGDEILDFSPMEGNCIEEDLKRRDFTVNGLGYDLRTKRLIDPVKAMDDIKSRTIRLISKDAVVADPLRMIRAFRFAAVLGFDIAPETLAVIGKKSALIGQSAGERISIELFKMMEVKRSFYHLKQMSDSGLLTNIIPELEPCRECFQNEIHARDVFEHTMATYDEMETALINHAVLWPRYASSISSYLRAHDRRVLLKLATLFHDLGKPGTRSVDSTGKVRFLGHEDEGADIVQDICARLRMSGKNRSYITLIVQKHLQPLFLFDAHQRDSLTSKGIIRFAGKYRDDIIGLLIHSVADQRAKAGLGSEFLSDFIKFSAGVLSMYFSGLKPKIAAPRLINGHELMESFNLKPSELIGRLLQTVEDARLNGDIETKKEATGLVARLLELEGDAGIEPATPSSGGLCSIR